MKRFVLVLLIIILVGGVAFFGLGPRMADKRFNRVVQPPPYEASEPARRLHNELWVADLHADMLLWNRDPLARASRGHVDVPRLLEGNVALQVFSVVTKSPWGQNYERTEGDSDRITLLAVAQRWPPGAWASLLRRALFQAEKLRAVSARSGGTLVLIETKGDLEQFVAQRAEDPRRVAGLLAVEGLHALEGDLNNVQMLYDAGFRMMAPTHLFDNDLGGAAAGVTKGGLTDFGRAVVRQMEALNVVVDLAHASSPLIADVLAIATRPVVVSHTGVKGTCDTPRNLSDAEIQGVAATGGVIGIGYWAGAVCAATPGAIVRAIRYVADLVGVEHVGLGSDFDGTVLTPFDTSGLVQLTDALLADGFTDEEIQQIMGGNVLRVLQETLPND